MSFIAVFVDLVGSNNILRICIAGQQQTTTRFPPFRRMYFAEWIQITFFHIWFFFSAALLDWKQYLRAEWNWNVLYIMFTMRLTWIDLLLNGSRANISRGIECPQVCVNWFPTFVFEKICAKKIIAIFLNSKIFAIFFYRSKYFL